MFNPDLFAKLESGEGYNRTHDKSILNPYVNFHNHTNTQSLKDMLVAESIQMRGVECFYLRREYVNLDLIFGEDPQSKFERAFKFATYVKSYEGYEGQRDFFGKFGMQVNDEIQLQINPGLFKYQTDGKLPLEGDLIYAPMFNALFEIVWVEQCEPFFQAGTNSIMSIHASKFIYSGEKIAPKVKVGHGMPPSADPACDMGLDLEEITRFEMTDELNPVYRIDGMSDIKKAAYAEDTQIYREASEFVDRSNFDPINGGGDPLIIPNSPFTDF